MKRILTFLLCLILVFSFCSCSGREEAPKGNANIQNPETETKIESADDIIGEWSVLLSVENALPVFGYTLTDLFGDFTAEEVGCTETLELTMKFEKDGKGSLILTGEEIDSFFLDIYTSFYTYLSDYSVATKYYSMTESELDSNAYDEYGVSGWGEAMQKVIKNFEAEALETPAEDSISDFTYSISEGELTVTYTADSTVEVYTLQNGCLVCIESDNTTGDPAIYTYTRIK